MSAQWVGSAQPGDGSVHLAQPFAGGSVQPVPPVHLALRDVFAAVQTLRDELVVLGPQDAAALLLWIAGDGTGARSVIGELTALMSGIVREPAVLERRSPAAGEFVVAEVAWARMTIDQVAGERLAQALHLLEQPALEPEIGFGEVPAAAADAAGAQRREAPPGLMRSRAARSEPGGRPPPELMAPISLSLTTATPGAADDHHR